MKYALHSSQSQPNRKIILALTVLAVISLALILVTLQEGFPFKPLMFLSMALLFVTFSYDVIFLFLIVFIVFQTNLNISFGRFVIQPIFLIIPFLFFKTVFDSFLEEQEIFSRRSVNFFLTSMMVAFFISSVKCYYTLGEQIFTKSFVFQFKFLVLALLFYIIAYYSKEKKNVYRIMKILIGLLLILSFSGIMEYVAIKIGAKHTIRSIFRLFGRMEVYSQFSDKTAALRISGLIGSPENFASILTFLLPPLIGLRFYSKRYRYLIDTVAVFSIISIILSGTRTALLSIFIYLIVLLLFESRLQARIKIVSFITLVLVLVYPLSLTMRGRLSAISTPDTYEIVMRKKLHDIAYDLFTKEKLFGNGWGTFDDNSRKNIAKYPVLYESRHYFRDGINRARSVYLQFLHDLGIFGLTIFLIFWASCMFVSLKVALKSQDIVFKYLGFGFLANLINWAILGYLGSGFFLVIGGGTILPAFFWIYYGLVSGIYRDNISLWPLKELREA